MTIGAQSQGHFTVMVTGQLESAEIPGCNNAYCEFEFVTGSEREGDRRGDWTHIDGVTKGITQLCTKSSDAQLVWNFPLSITYNSTNAFGWPQIVVSVWGSSRAGASDKLILGYGCMHIPTCAGRYHLKLRLFRPKSASLLQSMIAWFSGERPEFVDSKFPSYADGREVTTVTSNGHINVQLNVMTRDMEAFGFDDGSSRQATGVMRL